MKKNRLIGGCAALLLVSLASFGLWHTQGDASYQMDTDLAQFGIGYTVEPTDIDGKILSLSTVSYTHLHYHYYCGWCICQLPSHWK